MAGADNDSHDSRLAQSLIQQAALGRIFRSRSLPCRRRIFAPFVQKHLVFSTCRFDLLPCRPSFYSTYYFEPIYHAVLRQGSPSLPLVSSLEIRSISYRSILPPILLEETPRSHS